MPKIQDYGVSGCVEFDNPSLWLVISLSLNVPMAKPLHTSSGITEVPVFLLQLKHPLRIVLNFNHFRTNLVAKVLHWRQRLKSINFREQYVVSSTAQNWYFCLVNKILYPCFSDYVEEGISWKEVSQYIHWFIVVAFSFWEACHHVQLRQASDLWSLCPRNLSAVRHCDNMLALPCLASSL